ncbi:MAG: hypothetical protein K9K38_08185 [Rhodoferax sp.]|nr:hypothetical protein [Rhodoferax sp.]MCF8209365.1 hypothetical protein [Rhodoferax sp.]
MRHIWIAPADTVPPQFLAGYAKARCLTKDTQGQPWLVNTLAYEACFRNPKQRDRTVPVTVEQMRQASESLILRRDTHLDQLADKLREPRVKRVIEPMLQGEELPPDAPTMTVNTALTWD